MAGETSGTYFTANAVVDKTAAGYFYPRNLERRSNRCLSKEPEDGSPCQASRYDWQEG